MLCPKVSSRSLPPLQFPVTIDKLNNLSTDVWFEGMLLPKGSMVIWNVWGLHQDETYNPHPERFDPERFSGRTLLAPEYATSAEYESRDHYNYGKSKAIPRSHPLYAWNIDGLTTFRLFRGRTKTLPRHPPW
jgi:hypothetical protein